MKTKKKTKTIDIQKWLGKTRFEFHWPGYQYMGPGTKLDKRLKWGPGHQSIGQDGQTARHRLQSRQESKVQVESRRENDQSHPQTTRT